MKCISKDTRHGASDGSAKMSYSTQVHINILPLPCPSTKVGGAFLNHFQKMFLNKVFINIKIARKFKFCMIHDHIW